MEQNFEQEPHLESTVPTWYYFAYGLASGVITVLLWALVPMVPSNGFLLGVLFILVLVVVVITWLKLLQWLAERICAIPFQMRHIILALVAGYVSSIPLLLLNTQIGIPANIMILAGFTLGSGLSIRYFAS